MSDFGRLTIDIPTQENVCGMQVRVVQGLPTNVAYIVPAYPEWLPWYRRPGIVAIEFGSNATSAYP